MSDKNQGLYSTDIIANLLNLSARRVEQLTKKKIIPKAGRGVYDLGQAVQSYIRYLQGLCTGAIKDGDPSELDQRLLEAKVLERESKARQAKYRADAMEQDLRRSDVNSLIKKVKEIPVELYDRLTHDGSISAHDFQVMMTAYREVKNLIEKALGEREVS